MCLSQVYYHLSPTTGWWVSKPSNSITSHWGWHCVCVSLRRSCNYRGVNLQYMALAYSPDSKHLATAWQHIATARALVLHASQ